MKYIIDVRTREEFEEGAVEGALNFDLTRLMEGDTPDIPKDAEIYLYCRSGARSERASEILLLHGFTNAANLGGLEDAMKFAEK